MILFSEEMFVIYDNCMCPQQEIHRRYMDPKCVLALIFAIHLRSQNLQN